MSWRALTETDLASALSKSEIDAFSADADWNAGAVERNLAEVTAYVRGIIRSAPSSASLGPEGTLPESLTIPAIDFLRYRLLTRFDIPVSEPRSKAYEDAKALFDKIRSGDYIPEAADPAETEPVKAGSPASGKVCPHRLLD